MWMELALRVAPCGSPGIEILFSTGCVICKNSVSSARYSVSSNRVGKRMESFSQEVLELALKEACISSIGPQWHLPLVWRESHDPI